MPQLGDPEARLQQSLRLRDDDYAHFIAQFLRHLQDERPSALRDMARRSGSRAWLDSNAPLAARDPGLGPPEVPTPREWVASSAAVDQALKDADHLPGSDRPAVCADQVHTALQDYPRDVGARAGLSVAGDEAVARLFKSVRNGFPEFMALDQHDPRTANAGGSG